MFGSNFDANFGIPAFPVQGLDPQGGMFGPTAPDPSGAAPMPGIPTAPPAAAPGAPPAGAQPTLGATPSPLGAGPLAPGTAAAPPPAPDQGMGQAPPAAGLGSPFGKPGL